MPSQSKSLALLQQVVAALDIEPIAPGPITQADLNNSPYLRAKISPTNGLAGIRKEAARALYELAQNIFIGSARLRRGTTFVSLLTQLGDVIIASFVDRRSDPVTDSDVVTTEHKINEWFQATAVARRLFVPCVLSPWYAKPFDFGPVNFTHISDFIVREKQKNEKGFDIVFDQILQSMARDTAYWFATIRIEDCNLERSWELADLAIDLALAGVQLIVPLDLSKDMARLTARTIPRYRHAVSESEDGSFNSSASNQVPGLTMGDGTLELLLGNGRSVADSVGRRLAAFISGSGALAGLELAWADAAYWFHEGLAEPLGTIAVSKLETAIEVLMRSESSSGSKTRLVVAMKTFYGLEPKQPISPGSQITVETLAKDLVRDRSRILHGTWSTLAHSLQESRSTLTILTRELLMYYTLALDEYATTPGAKDDLDAFLRHIVNSKVTIAPTTAT